MSADQNLKKDAGKVRLELMDDDANEGIARVLGFGAQKYAADGWRGGMEWRRLIGAAKRHLAAFARGEDTDPESGLPHIDHLACCVHFLSAYQKQGLGTDDRYKTFKPAPAAPAPSVVHVSPLVPFSELKQTPKAFTYPGQSYDANGAPVQTTNERPVCTDPYCTGECRETSY